MEMVLRLKSPRVHCEILVANWPPEAHLRWAIMRCVHRGANRSALMTRQASFLVQAFNDSKNGRLKPNPPVACGSAEGARRTAERLSLSHAGVVAFSVTSDSETGDCDDQPKIFYRAGQLPIEFDSMP